MTGILSDVRFACRSLRANASLVLLAVMCLGIGIGATTMAFTVINNALLEPLGSIDPDGLVGIAEIRESTPDRWWPASWANFQDWETSAGQGAQMSALRGTSFDVGPNTSDARVEGAYVTHGLFAVLGVAPILGRGLQAGDDDAGSEPLVVLSETFWRQRFGADGTIVGRTLDIDGVSHTVVGVVPDFLALGVPGVIRSARVWIPFRGNARDTSRDDRSLLVVARLGPGVSAESFAARLETVAAQLAAIHRENAGWSVRVGPLDFSNMSRARPLLLLSLGAASLLLLVACANIANLMLAHATRRRHEFGIRTAIGASPWRIARQLLTESVLIAALGALLGLTIARSGLNFFERVYAAEKLAPAALPIDVTSLALTLVLTVVTTILVGLYPALNAARGATRAHIAESGSGTTTAGARGRLRHGLVVGQVAASLVLLIGAALLARSFMNLLALDGGVATERVTSVRAEPLEARSTPEDVARYVERIVGALSAIPGVESAASSNSLQPLRGGGFRSRVGVAGSTPEPSAGPIIAYAGVTPEFFDTLEIPLLRGRLFGESAPQNSSAVINQSLARLLWPNEDPVGRQFRLEAEPERGWITVTGVSGDVLTWDSSGDEPLPTAYFDAASFDVLPIFFFVKTFRADQIIGLDTVSRAIESLDIDVRRVVVTPMETVARDPFWRQRMFSLWFTAFGIAALVLTGIGIYGVLAYLVSQRWREIGIRMAVGAERHDVLLMILGQAARLVGAGILVGLVGAYLLARGMRALLFGVESLDMAVFIGVAVFLAVAVMASSLMPAIRAARMDANVLLRN